MENTSRQEERQVHGGVSRRVIGAEALVGGGMADDERLLPQQRLAQHLLPPVVHLGGKVVGVSTKQLVPQRLQQDVVLRRGPKTEGVLLPVTSDAGVQTLIFTLGLLQLETIFRIRLFRSSMLGMLSLTQRAEGFRERTVGTTALLFRGASNTSVVLVRQLGLTWEPGPSPAQQTQ